jgi:hypothetical protein
MRTCRRVYGLRGVRGSVQASARVWTAPQPPFLGMPQIDYFYTVDLFGSPRTRHRNDAV